MATCPTCGQLVPSSNGHRKGPPKPPAEPAEGWEEFWAAYPRRTAKAAGIRAWNKLKPDAKLRRQLLGALAAQVALHDWHRDRRGIFWPHPATWLNGRRWEDEVEAPANPAGEGFQGIEVGDREAERRELAALRPRRRAT